VGNSHHQEQLFGDNTTVRRALEGRLAEVLEEQATHYAETKQLSQEIERLSRFQDEAGARLESLRELLLFLRERDGEELIEVRRRLREELRGLIEKIDVRPVGRVPMTEKLAKRMTRAVLDVYPEINNRERVRLEKELASRIENRELRDYIIYFKGGSISTIAPATPRKLALEFDRESGRVRNIYQGIDGETVTYEIAS
jgi:hypothetical protein